MAAKKTTKKAAKKTTKKAAKKTTKKTAKKKQFLNFFEGASAQVDLAL